MLPSYNVITGVSVMDIPYENDKQYERDCIELVEEQNAILKEYKIYFDRKYKVHFFNSAYTNDAIRNMDIGYAIQCLAIKDGADLVRFGNGNIGFVAYYNGIENGFEILGEREDDDYEE